MLQTYFTDIYVHASQISMEQVFSSPGNEFSSWNLSRRYFVIFSMCSLII
jgi:hypothetical protein